MPIEQIEPSCELKSELARLCLPAATRDADRKFAWLNSICLLFLLIGLFGKPASIHIKPLPPPEVILPAIIEPVITPPPTTVQELQPEEKQPEEQVASQVIAVVPDSPDIHFSVPTIGNLLVPAALAVAPPLLPLKPPAAITQMASKAVLALDSTGSGGARPKPPYPRLALEHGQQGVVALLITADATGNITLVEVKASSGYPLLDRSTLDFVKRRWTAPPGAGPRSFEVTIRYRLEPE